MGLIENLYYLFLSLWKLHAKFQSWNLISDPIAQNISEKLIVVKSKTAECFYLSVIE